jgi:cold-inducible RNA-binding protein
MSKKLYVGNLSYSVDNRELETLFAAHGAVASANVIIDRETGRSKGFGFVEMGNDQEANAAISALHGKDVDGRSLTVNEARPREERSGGEFGSRNFGGGSHRGGFGGGRRF